jgi:hypothetical protein
MLQNHCVKPTQHEMLAWSLLRGIAPERGCRRNFNVSGMHIETSFEQPRKLAFEQTQRFQTEIQPLAKFNLRRNSKLLGEKPNALKNTLLKLHPSESFAGRLK